MRIEYPLYLIPLEAGYVSLVESDAEPGSADDQTYYLAIFTDAERAEAFMQPFGIEAKPRPLQNAREFAWMAQSLRSPVEHVAFDPTPESKRVEARWKVSIQELMEKHVMVDYSPWNYPVFLIQQQDGFASVEGSTSTGENRCAVGVFTTEHNAQKFLADAEETGVIQALDNVSQVREFLESVAGDASAVALDPTVSQGQRTAQYCFSVQTLLDKYLVEHKPGQ